MRYTGPFDWKIFILQAIFIWFFTFLGLVIVSVFAHFDIIDQIIMPIPFAIVFSILNQTICR